MSSINVQGVNIPYDATVPYACISDEGLVETLDIEQVRKELEWMYNDCHMKPGMLKEYGACLVFSCVTGKHYQVCPPPLQLLKGDEPDRVPKAVFYSGTKDLKLSDEDRIGLENTIALFDAVEQAILSVCR